MEELVINYQALSWLSRLKRAEIAKQIQMSPTALYRKLSGSSEFKISELNALAKALGVPVSRLVFIQ